MKNHIMKVLHQVVALWPFIISKCMYKLSLIYRLWTNRTNEFSLSYHLHYNNIHDMITRLWKSNSYSSSVSVGLLYYIRRNYPFEQSFSLFHLRRRSFAGWLLCSRWWLEVRASNMSCVSYETRCKYMKKLPYSNGKWAKRLNIYAFHGRFNTILAN